MMWDGKKITAQQFSTAPWTDSRAVRRRSAEAVQESGRKVKPVLEVKTRRVGGANYQVPVEVFAESAREPGDPLDHCACPAPRQKGMTEKLAGELLEAANMRGGAVKKKEDVHRMAEANKAFAHYRW